MDFGVKRLHSGEESARRYHLYNSKGKLTLVADHGSFWLPAVAQRQVRFARSDGQVVASLDLPEGGEVVRNGRSHTSYALILNHAVYAIINEYQEMDGGENWPYFVIEADGLNWLAWGRRQGDSLFVLYDHVPANLAIFDNPLESDQLDPIGHIHQAATGSYDFIIDLPTRPLKHAALIALALIFLVDQAALPA